MTTYTITRFSCHTILTLDAHPSHILKIYQISFLRTNPLSISLYPIHNIKHTTYIFLIAIIKIFVMYYYPFSISPQTLISNLRCKFVSSTLIDSVYSLQYNQSAPLSPPAHLAHKIHALPNFLKPDIFHPQTIPFSEIPVVNA